MSQGLLMNFETVFRDSDDPMVCLSHPHDNVQDVISDHLVNHEVRHVEDGEYSIGCIDNLAAEKLSQLISPNETDLKYDELEKLESQSTVDSFSNSRIFNSLESSEQHNTDQHSQCMWSRSTGELSQSELEITECSSSLHLDSIEDESHGSLNELPFSTSPCFSSIPNRSAKVPYGTIEGPLCPMVNHEVGRQLDRHHFSTRSLPYAYSNQSSSSSSLFGSGVPMLPLKRRVTIANEPEVVLFREDDCPRDIRRRQKMKRRALWTFGLKRFVQELIIQNGYESLH